MQKPRHENPLGLDGNVCAESCRALNQILVETMVLRDLYKKHHWQVSGPTFYALHLMYDKHHEEQLELVDAIAERVQILGGDAIAVAHDVAEHTDIDRPPTRREAPSAQLARLLAAHGVVLAAARRAARAAAQGGDEGTNDLLVSQVIRENEMQVWFVAEHLQTVAEEDQPSADGAQPQQSIPPNPTH